MRIRDTATAASEAPPLGVIAGAGHLPVASLQGMRSAGRRVAVVGLRDCFDASLPGQADHFASAGILQPRRWARLLRRWGVREAVMVGRVNKLNMYDPMFLVRHFPDAALAWAWTVTCRRDRRSDKILGALADIIGRGGVKLIDSTRYIPELMADAGVMTRNGPSAAQWKDIRFALPIVRRMGELDVGQSVAVRGCEIIAVEAIEGTDLMIDRAGGLCRTGRWTLLKVAKPEQDLRFDVPTVGPGTIERLIKAGATCLAVQAGKTIMLEKERTLEEAGRAGIAVVGLAIDEAGQWTNDPGGA